MRYVITWHSKREASRFSWMASGGSLWRKGWWNYGSTLEKLDSQIYPYCFGGPCCNAFSRMCCFQLHLLVLFPHKLLAFLFFYACLNNIDYIFSWNKNYIILKSIYLFSLLLYFLYFTKKRYFIRFIFIIIFIKIQFYFIELSVWMSSLFFNLNNMCQHFLNHSNFIIY